MVLSVCRICSRLYVERGWCELAAGESMSGGIPARSRPIAVAEVECPTHGRRMQTMAGCAQTNGSGGAYPVNLPGAAAKVVATSATAATRMTAVLWNE